MQIDALGDDVLGRRQPVHHGRLVAGGVAPGHQGDPAGGGARLDHHHVDLAGLVAPSGHRYLEDSLGDLLVVGNGTHSPFTRARRAAPMGPRKGMGLTDRAAEAPFRARTS